jgi:hypothetical protein
MLELWYGGRLTLIADDRRLAPLRVAWDAVTVGCVGGLVIMLRRGPGRVNAKGSL